jgi:molecular chaperone DnaK
VPQVEVTFDIDANGILNVAGQGQRPTNNEQKITITSSSGLSKDEVEKMAKDAESHAADDRKAKDQIEARNRADAMVYNVEKTLKEHRDKIGDGGREEHRSVPSKTSRSRSTRTIRTS